MCETTELLVNFSKLVACNGVVNTFPGAVFGKTKETKSNEPAFQASYLEYQNSFNLVRMLNSGIDFFMKTFQWIYIGNGLGRSDSSYYLVTKLDRITDENIYLVDFFPHTGNVLTLHFDEKGLNDFIKTYELKRIAKKVFKQWLIENPKIVKDAKAVLIDYVSVWPMYKKIYKNRMMNLPVACSTGN